MKINSSVRPPPEKLVRFYAFLGQDARLIWCWMDKMFLEFRRKMYLEKLKTVRRGIDKKRYFEIRRTGEIPNFVLIK